MEEAWNVDVLQLDEFMGSLQTYEMNLNVAKKEKELTFGVKCKVMAKMMMIAATAMMA